MKLLIDPVYTARPSVCSTSYLMWQLIEELSERHDDMFFYLLYPDKYSKDEEQMKFLQRRPDRVKLLPMKYMPNDRVQEIFKVTQEMIDILSPGYTPVWDFDVVLTSRVTMIPFLRNQTNREVSYGGGTYRAFIGLEEMPFFNLPRRKASWAPLGRMDLSSFAAYHASNGVVINNLYTKKQLFQLGKEWLTPSRNMEVQKLIREAVPVKLERLADNPKPIKKEANILFAGRMTSARNFKEIAELFRQRFAMPMKNGVQAKFIISTHGLSSGAGKMGEVDFIDLQYNDRDKFYALLKNKAHVVVNLSQTEDFSLSTYEPLLFGVPVIVPDEPWASFLGKDYPFIAGSHTEAYGLLSEFMTNYDAMYAKFRAWEATSWAFLVAGPNNIPTVDAVDGLIDEYDASLTAWLDKSEGNTFYIDLVAEISADKKRKKVDAMKFANERDFFVCPGGNWYNVPIGRRPNFYLLKRYMNRAGWTDTLEVGVFRRN